MPSSCFSAEFRSENFTVPSVAIFNFPLPTSAFSTGQTMSIDFGSVGVPSGAAVASVGVGSEARRRVGSFGPQPAAGAGVSLVGFAAVVVGALFAIGFDVVGGIRVVMVRPLGATRWR